MSFTAEDRRRLIEALDRMDYSARERTLDTFEAFSSWIMVAFWGIYLRIKDRLERV